MKEENILDELDEGIQKHILSLLDNYKKCSHGDNSIACLLTMIHIQAKALGRLDDIEDAIDGITRRLDSVKEAISEHE